MATNVGEAEVTVTYALEALRRDSARVAEEIRRNLKDPVLKPQLSTGSEITSLAQQLGSNFKGAKQFSEAIGVNAGQAANLIRQLEAMQKAGADLDDQFDSLNAEFGITKDQFSALASVAGNSSKTFEGIYKNFQEGITKSSLYTQALGEVSRQLQGVAGAANNFANQAQAAFVAFDSARGKVATLTNQSEKFADASRQLAKDLNFQQNSTDLLAASYDVLSSGFSEVSQVNEILAASARGAQGGFSDIGTVSDATTTILNAYKLSAADAAKVVDILAVTQDRGKITIDQYAATVGRAASIAALSGVSFEEFSAAVATATAKGVPAESAVSGVRQAIVNLLKPTADAQKILEKYGISSGAAALKAGGLIGVLQQLGDIPTEELSKVFSDVDALTSITPLAGSNLKDLESNFEAVNNSAGKAAKSAEQVANTFQGRTTAALNQANDALVSLGKGAAEAINPLLDAITQLLTGFNNLPDPVKEFIGLAVAISGGTLSAAAALTSFAAVFPAIKLGAIASKDALILFGRSVAAAIPAVLALAAAVAAIQFAKYFADLRAANESIESFTRNVDSAANEAFAAANRTKAAVDKLTEARKAGREISQQELKDAQALVTANKQRLESLKALQKQVNDEISALQGEGEEAEATRQAKENLLKQIELSIGALEKQNRALGVATATGDKNVQSIKEQASAYDSFNNSLNARIAANEKAYKAEQELIAGRANGKNQAEIDKQNLQAEQDYLNEKLKINQNALAQLKVIQASEKDPAKLEQIGQDIVKIEQQILDDRLKIAQNGAKARIDAEKAAEDAKRNTEAEARKREEEALKKLDDASKRAAQALGQAQTQRITQVKQAQLDGVIGEAEAQKKIEAIQASGIQKTIEAKTAEIDKVRKLRALGTISAEQAAQREAGLQTEIANLNLQAIDQELQARKRAEEEAAQLQQDRLSVAQQVAEQELQIRANALQAEQDLLGASLGVLQARNDLELEILGNQLKQAEAEGRLYDADRLRTQIKETQRKFEDDQYKAKIEQLKITEQLKQVELDREQVTTEIAIKQAEINIQKAQQAGATAEEVALLQKILGLEQSKLDQISAARNVQAQLNAAQLQELQTQRAITNEKRRQQDEDEKKSRLANGGLLPSENGSTPGGVGRSALGGGRTQSFIVTGDQRSQLDNAARSFGNDRSLAGQLSALQLNRNNQFAEALASPVAQKLAELSSTGFGGRIQAENLARQVDQGVLTADDVGRKLDDLINAVNRSSGRPNLTVSGVADLSLAGKIYSDISRDRMRASGL